MISSIFNRSYWQRWVPWLLSTLVPLHPLRLAGLSWRSCTGTGSSETFTRDDDRPGAMSMRAVLGRRERSSAVTGANAQLTVSVMHGRFSIRVYDWWMLGACETVPCEKKYEARTTRLRDAMLSPKLKSDSDGRQDKRKSLLKSFRIRTSNWSSWFWSMDLVDLDVKIPSYTAK